MLPVLEVPKMEMNGNFQLLERSLANILRAVHPLREDWTVRFYIIQELQKVVQSIESLRGATVEPFGSFVSNLFTRWGDLDISIELSNGSYISCPAKKHKVALLTDVLKALRKRGGWRNLHFIKNARIPILKFETPQNISCDVSINNLSGQMKSKMLFWMNEIDGRFRDVVILVKEWAKAQGVNEPKSGTLNSYSLSLLVVFHFQTCVPSIFPPLKDIYPGNMVDDLTGVRALAEKQIQDTFAVGINGYKADRSRGINRSSLSELFISFLLKFCDLSSRAQTQGINIFTGCWEDISTNMRWLPRTYALLIEDPFEQPINTARTVSKGELERITEAFQTSLQLLSAPNQDQNLLLSTLVQPQISRFLSKASAGSQTSNINGTNPQGSYTNGTRPQFQRAVQPFPRTQQHPQNRSNYGKQQTGPSQRSTQPMLNQAQQYRRPGS